MVVAKLIDHIVVWGFLFSAKPPASWLTQTFLLLLGSEKSQDYHKPKPL